MKNQILFAVLAVVAVYVSGAVFEPEAVAEPVQVVNYLTVVEPAAVNSRNLNLGGITNRDKLLYKNYYSKAPMHNAVQSQDIAYRGNATTRIAAIRVNEVGYTQNATARLTAGGINRNTATIRLTSSRGRGYNFQLEFWGH